MATLSDLPLALAVLDNPREAWSVGVQNFTPDGAGAVEIDNGDTSSLSKALLGLRRQVAAELLALKLTLMLGQFVETQQ